MPRLARSIRAAFVVACACVSFALASRAAHAQLLPPAAPPENPVTPAKSVLGKALFWDEQLSSDNTMACGTCHRIARGGGDVRFFANAGPDGIAGNGDDLFGSPGMARSDAQNRYEPDPLHGFLPQATPRNSPTFLLAAYFDELFWDGRAPTQFVEPQGGTIAIAAGGAVESLAVEPVVSPIEMAHAARSFDAIADKLTRSTPLALATNLPADVAAALAVDPTYPDLFDAAFGDPAIDATRIAFAIGSYLRTLVPDQTPWDDLTRGNSNALTTKQKAGLALFNGKAGCAQCHVTPLFSDGLFRANGLRDPATDPGRKAITGVHADRGKMKVPSLRNAGVRDRLMHTGQFTTIDAVVDFYDRGGDFADNRDPLVRKLFLTPTEKGQLIDFVKNGLVDPRVALEQAPFDRPTLFSESGAANPQLFGVGNAGSGGFVPRAIAASPPNLGNIDFKLGVHSARGSSPAWLLLTLAKAPPGAKLGKIPVLVDASQLVLLVPFATTGSGAGGGHATAGGELPNDPTLIGIDLFAQWFVADPVALGKVATSEGIEMTLF